MSADREEALERDAARYRWLRENTYVEGFWIDGAGGVDTKVRVQGSVHFLDEAVDRERSVDTPPVVSRPQNELAKALLDLADQLNPKDYHCRYSNVGGAAVAREAAAALGVAPKMGERAKALREWLGGPVGIVSAPNDSRPYAHFQRWGDVGALPVGAKLYAITDDELAAYAPKVGDPQ